MNPMTQRLTAILGLILTLSACEPGDYVARVGNAEITTQELLQELKHAGLPPTDQNLELLLSQLIAQRAAETQVEKLQLADEPDYRRRLGRLALEVLRKRYEQEVQAETPLEVSEAEIQAAYDSDPERFLRPAKARTALIVFENPGPANQREERVRKVNGYLQHLKTLEGDQLAFEFQRLASEHSLDRASRYRGGDVGFLQRGTSGKWPAEVVDAAFALEQPGELASDVVTTPDALYVVRLLERENAYTEPLAAVRKVLRQEILTRKYDEIKQRVEAKLMAGLSVERNEDLLASLRVSSEKQETVLPGPALN